MKIETQDFLTVAQAMAVVDCSRRALYRAIKRAADEGAVVTQEVLGRRLILRSAIPVIKKHYYPFGSDKRSEMAKQWGAKGGSTKAANRRKSRRQSS